MELTGTKILFVEDDEFIGGIITHHIENSGADYDWVRNGQDALSKLKESKYDIILTDLVMGEHGGVEMIKHVRADQNLIDIPVLVLTNLGNDDKEVVEARELGVQGFFAKSSTPFESLAGVISCILGNPPSKSAC